MINLGRDFNLHLDEERKVLIIETRGLEPNMSIEIPISDAFIYESVKWNKKAGEKFEDVAKKKPEKLTIFKE